MAKSKAAPWLTEEGLRKVEGWARNSLSESQIAHNMGISESTLNTYKRKYPQILESIARGREDVVEIVENVIYQQIKGYEYEEKEIVEELDPDTGEVTRRMVKTKLNKSKPSERQAQFFLRNKAPDKWNGKGMLELERLQLENERLRAELEERKQSNTNSDYEKDKKEFEAKIDNTLVDYVNRLKGWFDET